MSQEMVEYVQYNFDMSCDRCDEIFESLPHAIRHYSSEHSEPKGYIKCCNKKFRTLATIDDHIHWHKNPESWKLVTGFYISYSFHIVIFFPIHRLTNSKDENTLFNHTF